MAKLLSHDDMVLIGDGALITCGLSAGLTAIVLLLSQVAWADSAIPVWMELLSATTFFGSAFGGPVLVWLASKRRISATAVLGAVLGGVLSAVSLALLAALSGLFQLTLRWIQTEGPWGLVVVGALGLVLLAVVAVHLLKDTRADRRLPSPAHPLLNVLRIAAAVIVVVYTSTIVVVSLMPRSGELIEALAFMLIGAVNGASLVAGAALLTRLMDKRGEPAADAGVSAT